jgi:hypothetical protein
MSSFKRFGREFSIAPFDRLFDNGPEAPSLAAARHRLLLSSLISSEGLISLLSLWVPEHEDVVAAAAEAYEREAGRPPSSSLQRWSLGWRHWEREAPEAAHAFRLSSLEAVWDRLHPTQKTTFLAITHALGERGLTGEIARVTDIKGEGKGSGVDQFRLWVILAPTALDVLWDTWGPPDTGSIHPGYPTSFREPRGAPPRLQFCTRPLPDRADRRARITHWQERSDRWADVDIDYRKVGEFHLDARNSDATAKVPRKGEWHVARHQDAYGRDIGFA